MCDLVKLSPRGVLKEIYLDIGDNFDFFFQHKNIYCGYSLRGTSNEYHMFWWRTRENDLRYITILHINNSLQSLTNNIIITDDEYALKIGLWKLH